MLSIPTVRGEGRNSLEWVVPRFSGLVHRNVVPSVSLVNINLALKRKTGQSPHPFPDSKQDAGDAETDGGVRTFSAI